MTTTGTAGGGGKCHGSGRPPLKVLHPEEAITSTASYAHWKDRPTGEIVDSLRPDSVEPLIVKGDGTIMNGNTRAYILRERGHDVDSLPREPYTPSDGGYHDTD